MLYPLSYGGRSHRVAVSLTLGDEFGIWQAGGVDEAERVIAAIESRDWDRLRTLLHPVPALDRGGQGAVSSHEKLPIGGRNCPLMAMVAAHWWPRKLPTGLRVRLTRHAPVHHRVPRLGFLLKSAWRC